MAQSLLPVPVSSATTSAGIRNSKSINSAIPIPGERKCDINGASHHLKRRAVICGFIAAGIGPVLSPENANAAKRRPPPPAPAAEEKQDPNVSGVLAKVLASKKRKEAMKEAVAKMREKGNTVD